MLLAPVQRWLISIPPGPIEAGRWVGHLRQEAPFQFHLVRLKPLRRHPWRKQLLISIPPGPIEACSRPLGQQAVVRFQFHLVRLKPNSGVTFSSTLATFQFHLVRLKPPRHHLLPRHHQISIPPGPIEAARQGIARPLPRKFQFHLVRLKLTGGAPTWPRLYHFNSTWSD